MPQELTLDQVLNRSKAREKQKEFTADELLLGEPAKRGVLEQVGSSFTNALASLKQLAMPESVAEFAFPPLAGMGIAKRLGQGVVAGGVEQWRQGGEALKQGNIGRAVRKRTLGMIPMVGPLVEETGEKLADPNRRWEGATDIALMALPGKIPGVKLPRIVRNLNTPVEETALRATEGVIPMTVGQRTGNRMLQRLEQGLENVPGASTRTQEFFRGQQEALASEGQRLTGTTSPIGTSPYQAGKAVQERLATRIARLKGRADTLYETVRNEAAANVKKVQTGTKPSPILDAQGRPLSTPVFETFETPVQLDPIRQHLAGIYEDLVRAMPEARRAASPAFKALDDLMRSGDPFMNAMDFDKSLSAIKALTRDGNSPFLTTKSQGIAKQIVRFGEQELESAMAQAGPTTVAKLKFARKNVRAYHDTAELLADLSGEPAQLYSNLIAGGDRTFNQLKELSAVAPNEVKTIGRTFLQGLIDKATAEGGFRRAQGIMGEWNKLGPETKRLLFGAQQAKDLDHFMLTAKRLTTDVNPSGSAKVIATLGSYGAIGESMLALIMGHPGLAAIGPAAMVGSRLLAEVLLTPRGARMLTAPHKVLLGAGRTIQVGALTAPYMNQPQPMPPR